MSGDNIIAWVRGQILANIRVVKYGIVGLFGVAINLATMAMLITMTSQRGWVPSTLANVVSTITNFILHNLWTFSDRQHQGARLVRGFLSFVVTSVLGIGVTTVAYLGFTHLTAHLAIASSRRGALFVALSCQFVAILIGACVSYTLNREFTWAAPKEEPSAEGSPVRETLSRF